MCWPIIEFTQRQSPTNLPALGSMPAEPLTAGSAGCNRRGSAAEHMATPASLVTKAAPATGNPSSADGCRPLQAEAITSIVLGPQLTILARHRSRAYRSGFNKLLKSSIIAHLHNVKAYISHQMTSRISLLAQAVTMQPIRKRAMSSSDTGRWKPLSNALAKRHSARWTLLTSLHF